MDQSFLVKAGHVLVKALDDQQQAPRAAVWVHNTDTDTWKLWIVPHTPVKDWQDFYRQLSTIVTQHRNELGDVDAADVELVGEDHPGIKGLKAFMKMPGLGSAHLSNNRLNGFFLPEGIVLRMDV
jgi:hypothetical protein